ncbi:MAG: hypothetical protein CMI96_00460 [Pelagibacteraceae bacterium]|nr:hypothetical protein [Pelagibacteraceae bacterium]|tara:strand:+ start:4603 stop:6222 length:1620 start_codon:yes stop_codon:yes gene_type:complete
MSENYSKIINNGIREAKNNNFISSKLHFENAIKLNFKKNQAYINLSNLYFIQKKHREALSVLINYILNIKYDENIARHLLSLTNQIRYSKKINKIFDLKKLSNKKHKHKNIFFIYYIAGKYFEKNNKIKQAIKFYELSINIKKNYVNSYMALFNLFEKNNNINKFNILIKSANNRFKNNPKIKFFESLLLFRKHNYKKSLNLIQQNNLSENLKHDINLYPVLLDIISKNNDKIGNHDLAFKKINQRNIFILGLPKNKKINKNLLTNTINIYKNFYTKQNLKIQNDLNTDEKLVFLLGFPRSGTTLLDSILRTHSKTLVLEEKPYLINIRHKFFQQNNNKIESLAKISSENIFKLQKQYFEQININKDNYNKIIIDKFPLSIIELGFIKKIFPQSKIILLVRNPCDVVISCFFSYFKTNEAMINFLDLSKTINLYNMTFDLFTHLEREFSIKFHLIKYEEIVYNFDTTLKKLLKYLNLKNEPNLSQFFKTAKKRDIIKTPSYNQVIEPLYISSINRWQRYKEAKFIKNELDYWMKKFKYF